MPLSPTLRSEINDDLKDLQDTGRAIHSGDVEFDLADICQNNENIGLNVLRSLSGTEPRAWTRIAQEHLMNGRLGMAEEVLREGIRGESIVSGL